MGLFENLNRGVRKFDVIDIKLAQGAAMFFALVIAKLIPDILDINICWFVVLFVLCAIKPVYVFWFKK